MSQSIDYIINTNNPHRLQDEIDMVDNKMFGTFCENSRKIDHINGGDTVFLYKKGKGIIAYGQATGIVEVKDRIKPENNELVVNGSHYQKFSNFTQLRNPLTASQIKQVLGRYVAFNKTIFKLHSNEGEKIISFLEKDN
ncbi:EVE domain-containing protein [Vibrio breoganii]|uniref:EVE domain-containing protein n=1 Tax=Vibrio breoganii TaxID=553239 RepID=UPI000C831E35|nr:EVE domain-containing protein [Vibrio breoganii]PMG07548.1 hypothetical protein BCV00_07485 [Vibrio breoganii]PMJ45336.1 hypothetical protein BCU21_13745 [Vibrio breoganii]PMK59450.1 hypothetical protein BCT97_06585 [Vibrio breoganii]PMO29249.1 hypothetical protein BCT14_06760 [Vibrio breoganii]PMO32915.1 hypothetical protein BCT13_08435 [Vibrio breoganii]